MLVVRATKKLLDRLGPVTLESGQTSTTRLGDWYASAWAWRPQVALFVSEATLFPILMPLAPAATLLARFPDGLAQALAAHDVPEAFITQELSRMQDVRLGKTASRSVLGIMNEFTFLAQTMRGDTTTDLTDLARWLARTPCSPLFKRHGSPDRELRALVEPGDTHEVIQLEEGPLPIPARRHDRPPSVTRGVTTRMTSQRPGHRPLTRPARRAL